MLATASPFIVTTTAASAATTTIDTNNLMSETTVRGTSAPSNVGTVAAVVIVMLICIVVTIVVIVLLMRRLQAQKAQLLEQQAAQRSTAQYSQPRDSSISTPSSHYTTTQKPISNQYGNLSLTQPLDEHSTYASMPSERDVATASAASSANSYAFLFFRGRLALW